KNTPDLLSNRKHKKTMQVIMPHEIAVALAGGATAFVEGPDHEALAPAAIPCGKDALDIGRIFVELGIDVGARVAFHAESLKEGRFRPEKTHRQQQQLNRVHRFG